MCVVSAKHPTLRAENIFNRRHFRILIQIEAIRGYNEMKEALNEFLRSFAEQGKVVTEADVKQFFAEMKASKKQKVEIPKFCR
jgi:hypothetical protein